MKEVTANHHGIVIDIDMKPNGNGDDAKWKTNGTEVDDIKINGNGIKKSNGVDDAANVDGVDNQCTNITNMCNDMNNGKNNIEVKCKVKELKNDVMNPHGNKVDVEAKPNGNNDEEWNRNCLKNDDVKQHGNEVTEKPNGNDVKKTHGKKEESDGNMKKASTKTDVRSLIGKFNLKPPTKNDSPKLKTRKTKNNKPQQNNTTSEQQIKITTFCKVEAKKSEDTERSEKVSDTDRKETVETSHLENKTVALRPKNNLNLKAKPKNNSNSDTFNLKEFLALKKREREDRISKSQDSTNRIDRSRPSPLNTVNVGKKEDYLRQNVMAMRRNAAAKQLNMQKEGGNVTDPEIGSKQEIS